MSLIVLDLDDTISLTANTILKFADTYHYEVLKRSNSPLSNVACGDYYYFAKIYGWDESETIRFFNDCYPHYLADIECKADAAKATKQLSDYGWEIHILTSRCEHENYNIQKITETWLIKNNIVYDHLKINCNNKAAYLRNVQVNAFVDDSFDNCKAASEILGVSVFMIDTPFNRELHDKRIVRVNKLSCVVNSLTNI